MTLLCFLIGAVFFSSDVYGTENTHPQLFGVGSSMEASVDGHMQRTRVFKGIPYAIPPIGQLRWKPAKPYAGVIELGYMDSFGAACMQPPHPITGFFYRPISKMSEDCLYLNVWSPEIDGESYAVMVWFHGGNLIEGSTSNQVFDGAELAKKGVVVVSVNYRLGIFGYFAHPDLSLESPHRVSGNYGLTDQIEALKWIQKNIRMFGGDPEKVTVFGHSAGAFSILQLLTSPVAEGLMHSAIIQSGYLPPIPALREKKFNRSPAEQWTGLNNLADSSITYLRSLSEVAVLNLAINGNFEAFPNQDGWLLPSQIIDRFEQGTQVNIPILIGFTNDEATPLLTYDSWLPAVPKTKKQYVKGISERYPYDAEEYLELYLNQDLEQSVLNSVRDGFYGWAAQKIAKTTSKINSNIYLYYFDHAPEWSKKIGMGAFHGSELAYTFNNVKHGYKYSPSWPDYTANKADLEMADIMSDYWVSFAKNGDPNQKGRPAWKPYGDENRGYMLFHDGKAIPESNLLLGTFELHEKIVRQRRARGTESWWLDSLGLLAPVREDDK